MSTVCTNRRAVRSIKSQIESEKDALRKLAEVKEYIRRNFEATQRECDAVLDVIAQVCDRREQRVIDLQGKLLGLI